MKRTQKYFVLFILLFFTALLHQNCGQVFTAQNLNKVKVPLVDGGEVPAPETPSPVSEEACENVVPKLASIFQENMVLHHSFPKIWGTAKANTNIWVGLKNRGGLRVKTQVNSDGQWRVTIPKEHIVVGPTEVIVDYGCKQKVNIKKVLIGEVWLCSGQSNMVWPVSRTTSHNEVVVDVNRSVVQKNIRFIDIEKILRDSPQKDFRITHDGTNLWSIPNSENVQKFSSVCYHFGRELQKKINKPLGLVLAAHGGSRMEAWMADKALPERYKNFTAQQKQHRSSLLYNGLIHPIRGLKISGVAWYQGESNSLFAGDYTYLQFLFFKHWRQVFGDPKLPFALVQLAGYSFMQEIVPGEAVAAKDIRTYFPELRQSQYIASLRDANVEMVTALGTITQAEADEGNNPHPAYKKIVGTRLARKVGATIYNLYEDDFPHWLVESTYSQNGVVYVALRYGKNTLPPQVGKIFRNFALKQGNSSAVYTTDARVVALSAESRIVWIGVRVQGFTNPGKLFYNYANSPLIDYRFAPHQDVVPPLCLVKNSEDEWYPCPPRSRP